jgi:hypothetical protein
VPLVPVRADHLGRRNPQSFISIQPLVIVKGSELAGIVGERLHCTGCTLRKRRNGGVIEVGQVTCNRELLPALHNLETH